MRTTVLILLGILILIKLLHRKSKRSVSAPDDDGWKKNKTRTTRKYNSAGYEVNPRRNGLAFDKKSGKFVNVKNPFND